MGDTHMVDRVGAESDKGPSRPVNQDAYWVPVADTPLEFGRLYLVADGVGGQQAGGIASQIAVSSVQAAFYAARKEGRTIPQALVTAIEQGNHAVFEESQKRGGRMGSTLVAAVHDNAEGRSLLHIAHVGDARAYLARERGIQRLTRDDTWVQRQVDAGLLTRDEAAQHELRHVVTQVLGNKPEIEVHLAPDFSLEPGDVILLCSDGLYDAVAEPQLHQILLEYAPDEAARMLLQEAIEANAADNITAVVVEVGRPLRGIAADSATTLTAAATNVDALATTDSLTALPTGQATAEATSRKTPTWLWITILSVIGLLALVAFFIWLATRQNDELTPEATVSLPSPTINIADAGGGLATTAVETPIPPSAVPTSDVPTSDVPTPAALATITVAATTAETTPLLPTTAVALACVADNILLFVWSEQQISAEPCTAGAGQVVQDEDFVLRQGQTVEILGEEIRIVDGPDSSCQPNELIQVRSVDNPAVEGWVLESSLRRVAAGESCRP
jgi:protein phosphatase